MKTKLLACLLATLMLLPLLAACKPNPSGGDVTTDPGTGTTAPVIITTEEGAKPMDPPSYDIDPNASVYSGTPDTSWYTGDKTEYILTSADQLVGFHSLRSETFNYEGITVKLDCDVIINPGTAEEVKARASGNHSWKELNSSYLFKGTFDGQGHIISGVYMQLGGSGVKGMFGGVGGNAVLKNFTLINSYFGGPSATGKHSMGAIAAKVAGEGANVTFSGVNVNAILEEGSAQFSRVGGLIGQVSENVTLTLENCQFDGSISITGSYAGGMIGYASALELTVHMTGCANRGNISATTYAGGMTGVLVPAYATQTNCQNLGVITAEHDAGDLNGRISMMKDPTNGARPTAPEGTTALRVMSFNVQASLPKENGQLTQASQNRIEAVKQEILFYSPDLLGLQEDSETWVTQLRLADYNILHDGTASSSGERCAIFYKKGLKLLSSGTAWLTATRTGEGAGLTYEDLSTPGSKYYMTPEELAIIGVSSTADLKAKKTTYVDQTTGKTVTMESGSYVLLDTRKVTYGVFDINGQTVIYMNTHLQHRKPNAEYSNDAFQKVRSMERLKEFDLMQETLAEVKKTYPDALVFMTGDWNDLPYTAIYESIVTDYGYVCTNFDTLQKYGVNGSWNNAFNLEKQGDNYPSKSEGTSGSYLDYCFVSPEIDTLKFRVGAGKAEITLNDGSKKTIYTSDHLPIIADICFKTPKTGSPIDPDYQDPTVDPTVYSGIADMTWYTGDKTEYILTSADQLMGFQALRAQQISFEGVTIKLGCDVTINQGTAEEIRARGTNNYDWAQLNSSYFFKGTFDGQGHTISGLYMQLTTAAVRGMFGGVSGNAVIKNFTLENSYFGGPSANKQVLGTLVAKVSSGANVTISNVTVNSLMQEGDGTLYYIGGLVGNVEAGCTLTLENCEYKGAIQFPAKGTKIGGLVGAVQAGATLNLNGCRFSGSIQALSEAETLVGYVTADSVVNNNGSTSTGTLS
ncbi:MAG: hypothetical protein IJX28_01910 [Clostridia bacterium]|nr:hypothetical protein [Clostridia bacterium]